MKGIYRRKAGRAVQIEDDDDDDDDDPDLVENLEDDTLDAVLGRPVAAVPSVNRGERTVASGAAQTTAKRKPSASKKGPAKGGRAMLGRPVQGLEDEQEDFSALLDAIGATSTDEDGVPSFPSAAPPRSHSPATLPASKNKSRVPGKSRGAGRGRGRGFASTSKRQVTQVQEMFHSSEGEDFTLGLANISDTSV